MIKIRPLILAFFLNVNCLIDSSTTAISGVFSLSGCADQTTRGAAIFSVEALAIPAAFIRSASDIFGNKNASRITILHYIEKTGLPSEKLRETFVTKLDRIEPGLARIITPTIIGELFARDWPIRLSEVNKIFQHTLRKDRLSMLDTKKAAYAIDDTLTELGIRPTVWGTRMILIPGLLTFFYAITWGWHQYSKTPLTLPLLPMLAIVFLDQLIKGLSNRYLHLRSLTAMNRTKKIGIHTTNQFHRRSDDEILLGLLIAMAWALIALIDGGLIIPHSHILTSIGMGAVFSNILEAWYLGGATNVVLIKSKYRATTWNMADFVINAMFFLIPLSLIWKYSESKNNSESHIRFIDKLLQAA
jgi:hypothetical protein